EILSTARSCISPRPVNSLTTFLSSMSTCTTSPPICTHPTRGQARTPALVTNKLLPQQHANFVPCVAVINFRLGDVGNDEQTGQDFIIRVDRRIAQEFLVNQTEINRGLIGRSIRSVIGNVGAHLRIED